MREDAECRMIRTTEALRVFAADWNALWREDPCATPFQSPQWLLPWWRQFEQPELRAISIRQCGACIGFLPFYIYREPKSGERKLLLMGAGTTDYLDGVFASACSTEHVQEAVARLRSTEGWDVLRVSQLPAHSKLLRALQQLKDTHLRQFQAESCSQLPAVPIAALPPKIRRNATYYRSLALRVGTLSLEVANQGNLSESFDALTRLHTQRWQARGQAGVLTDERVVSWHREALPLLEQSGMLRLCLLRLNGEIIAALYALADPPQRPARNGYFYLIAHSVEHARLSPGTLLVALAIESAANEGIRMIDFLRGDENYKKYWHPQEIPTSGFVLQNPVVRERTLEKRGAAV